MAYWPDLTKGASFEELFAQLGNPEFREYNNIKGWGEYYKTLETKTEDGLRELGQQLKAANAARDVKRFKLIKDVRDQLCLWWTRKKLLEWSISGDEEDDDLWDFHDSGLADAVLDVASDERIYVQENEEEVNYFHHVYSSLHACLCGYFRIVQRWRRKHLKNAKYFLERTNKLYLTLWRRREQTLDHLSDALWGEYYEGRETTTFLRLVHVAVAINKLHYECYVQVQSLNYGRAYHVAMYVWMRTRDLFCTEGAWKLYCIGQGNEGPILNNGPNDNVGLRQFLTEAIVNTHHEEALISKMTFVMLHPDVMEKEVMAYMSGLRAIAIVCPPVLHPVSFELLSKLRDGCSIACQRQLCSAGEISNGVMYEIFKVAFYMISFTRHDLFEVAKAQQMTQDQATNFLQEIIRIKFMPLFLRLLHLPALEERATPDFISCLVRPISLLRDTMTTKLLGQSHSPRVIGLVRNVAETTRTVWYPILTRLRQLKAKRDHREQMLTFVVDLWEQVGQACNLKQSERITKEPAPWGSERHLAAVQEYGGRIGKRGCALESCLCLMDPAHKMKVCKGCWRVFYCSPICQEK
ncbi:hypothetical protein BC629DRAFT_1587409 [Irpex lacteus]|nr:hypothetical protein BC629DRAFT_1587409 [Irpex lacteus]